MYRERIFRDEGRGMAQGKQLSRSRVLLATDRAVDEGSLKCAARVVQALDAHMDFWIIVETVDEMKSVLPLLRKEMEVLRGIAPDVEAEVRKGLAAEIMSGIREGEYDLVVLLFRGRRGLKKVFPRAEVLSILHHARVNFLILWGKGRELKRFLFCTGGSPYGQQAVEFGARIASALKAEATLLCVAETEPTLYLEGGRDRPQIQDRNVRRAIDKALDTLEKAGVRVEVRTRYGKVADQILAEATASNCDLIVMGSHGMGGIRRFILGSVSEEVARRARIPVLIVRAREERTFWRRVLHLRG
jgi:nucleotide-binding universal stress UspA family protein